MQTLIGYRREKAHGRRKIKANVETGSLPVTSSNIIN